MIYVDASVALAQLLSEGRRPDPGLWDGDLVASRLLVYECWTRIHARSLGTSHGEDLRKMLGHLSYIELVPAVLLRCLDPFPVRVRTLDAIHLASAEFVRGLDQDVRIATYDDRLAKAARALGSDVFEP